METRDSNKQRDYMREYRERNADEVRAKNREWMRLRRSEKSSFECASCSIRTTLGARLGSDLPAQIQLPAGTLRTLRKLAKEFDHESEKAGMIFSASEFLDWAEPCIRERPPLDDWRWVVDEDTFYRRTPKEAA